MDSIKSKVMMLVCIIVIIALIVLIILAITNDTSQEMYDIAKNVYISGQDAVDKSTGVMEDAAKKQFNNKFLKYEGTQKGSTIKTLMQEVKASNISFDSEREVKLKGITSSEDITATKKYTVKCNYDQNGYINEIEVTLQN